MGFHQIVSLQGTVTFDPSIVVLDSVRQFRLPSMNANQFGLMPDRLTFAWDDPSLQGVTRGLGDTLFVLHFRLIGNPGQLSAVAFSDVPTPREYADTSLTAQVYFPMDGSIRIEELPTSVTGNFHQATRSAQIYPVPLTQSSRLTGMDDWGMPVDVVLAGMDGRVWMDAQGLLLQDSPVLERMPIWFSMPTGMYHLRVVAGAKTHVFRILWTQNP
jgi:hypothetical protein